MSEILPLTRVAYQAQQAALRWSLVAAHYGLRPLLRHDRRPTERDARSLRRRLNQLFAQDLANVEAGAYPAELLFQLPVREYLWSLPELVAELPRMAWRAKRGAVRVLAPDVDLGLFPD
jgi:hypothetical protein